MKNINKILIILSLGFVLSYGADSRDDILVNQDERTMYNTSGFEDITVDEVQEQEELSQSGAEDGANSDAEYGEFSTEEDIEASMEIAEDMSEFEKLFVNHSAYIYYSKGIEELYKANYKAAYKNAMKAKAIIDNTDKPNEQVIALPYMPNYIRETAYTPKRIYYKTVKAKPYELKRLITKAKLISPPVASVVVKRTSTYLEIITRNYGDLPLDEFELLLNDESIVKYDKILPNEQKTTRIGVAPTLYEISFKEKYGFAPKSIMLSEGE